MSRVTLNPSEDLCFKIGDIVTNKEITVMVTDQCEGQIEVDDGEFVGVVLHTSNSYWVIGELYVGDKREFSNYHGNVTIESF